MSALQISIIFSNCVGFQSRPVDKKASRSRFCYFREIRVLSPWKRRILKKLVRLAMRKSQFRTASRSRFSKVREIRVFSPWKRIILKKLVRLAMRNCRFKTASRSRFSKLREIHRNIAKKPKFHEKMTKSLKNAKISPKKRENFTKKTRKFHEKNAKFSRKKREIFVKKTRNFRFSRGYMSFFGKISCWRAPRSVRHSQCWCVLHFSGIRASNSCKMLRNLKNPQNFNVFTILPDF